MENIVWVARVGMYRLTGEIFKTVVVEARNIREAIDRAEEFGVVLSIQTDRRTAPRSN